MAGPKGSIIFRFMYDAFSRWWAHYDTIIDYVLIDCPAGIEQGFKNAVAGADRALVVTTPKTFLKCIRF